MARCYDIRFRTESGADVWARAYGNTRTSAERSARRALREDGHDTKRCYAVEFVFVPEGKRK